MKDIYRTGLYSKAGMKALAKWKRMLRDKVFRRLVKAVMPFKKQYSPLSSDEFTASLQILLSIGHLILDRMPDNEIFFRAPAIEDMTRNGGFFCGGFHLLAYPDFFDHRLLLNGIRLLLEDERLANARRCMERSPKVMFIMHWLLNREATSEERARYVGDLEPNPFIVETRAMLADRLKKIDVDTAHKIKLIGDAESSTLADFHKQHQLELTPGERSYLQRVKLHRSGKPIFLIKFNASWAKALDERYKSVLHIKKLWQSLDDK